MGNTLTRTDALIAEINERQRLEREVVSACKEFVEIRERGDVESEYLAYRGAYDNLKATTRALK